MTTIREYLAADEEAILAAFQRVYAEVDPEFEPRSPARWRWQYLANPAGARIELALSDDGAVLAQYAGQSRFVRAAGQRLRTSHCADSLVLPEARALGKNGLFVRTGQSFARRFGGAGEDDDRWMWGFPVAAAQRIGERSLGYRSLRAQSALVLEQGTVPRGVEAARRAAMVGREYDALFERRAGHYGAVGERDAAYLRWRYFEHPEFDYRLLEARDTTGLLTGYAAGRRARFEGREVWALCDWFADPGAWPALARGALREARGLPLLLIVPPWSDEFAGLQELGFRVRPTSLLLVGHSHDRQHDLRFWSERWYYTLGDSDLV